MQIALTARGPPFLGVASQRGFVKGIISLLLIGMELRHPATDECEVVEALVQTVVDEIYGGLWARPPIPIGLTDWSPAWVAISQGKITGMALTGAECVEDLWVAANARGNPRFECSAKVYFRILQR
jgi:hypothetical protein